MDVRLPWTHLLWFGLEDCGHQSLAGISSLSVHLQAISLCSVWRTFSCMSNLRNNAQCARVNSPVDLEHVFRGHHDIWAYQRHGTHPPDVLISHLSCLSPTKGKTFFYAANQTTISSLPIELDPLPVCRSYFRTASAAPAGRRDTICHPRAPFTWVSWQYKPSPCLFTS
jgi:hypothetical protein